MILSYKIIHKFLLLWVCFISGDAKSQKKECLVIMEKADKAIISRNYDLALTKLRAVKICSPELSSSADDKILTVFNLIKAERNAANSAKNEAVKQTKIAIGEKKKAIAAQAVTERQTFLTQLSAMSSNSVLLARQDPTLGFRLASIAYRQNPTTENAGIIHSIVSDNSNLFYKFKIESSCESYAFNDQDNILYYASQFGITEYDGTGRFKRQFQFNEKNSGYTTISPQGTFTLLSDTLQNIFLYSNHNYFFKSTKWLKSKIEELRWSQDGKFIFLSSLREGKVYVLDTSLNVVFSYFDREMRDYDFASDLEYFVVSHEGEVILRDTSEGSDIDTIPEPFVSYLNVSWDGERIYTVRGGKNQIKWWTIEEGRATSNIFSEHNASIQSLSFIPSVVDGHSADKILSTSADGVNIIWDSKGTVLKVLKHIPGNGFKTTKSVFSSEGKRIITSSANDIYYWDLQNNSLGNIATLYPRISIADFSHQAFIKKEQGNAFILQTTGGEEKFESSPEDPVFEMSLVDKSGTRLLIKQIDRLTLLNRATGSRRLLIKNRNAYIQSNIDAGGNILLWHDKTISLFDTDGNIKIEKTFSNYVNQLCLVPYTSKVFSLAYDHAYLIDLRSKDTIKEWYVPSYELFQGQVLKGLNVSPYSDFIIAWSDRKAILFDTGWNAIRFYELGYTEKALFSEYGDSIYFLSSSGVDVRYTLAGLIRSDEICTLSVSDNIRYNVPGYLKDIVKRANWGEYDQCVFYFYFNYLENQSELAIYQLKYLSAHNFFQKTENYYSNLDGRINWLNSAVEHSRNRKLISLETVLSNMRNKLKKEKQRLNKTYGKSTKY